MVQVRDGDPGLGLETLEAADEVMTATDDHPVDCRVTNMVRLGEAYMALGRFDEAESVLLGARDIYDGPRWAGVVERSWDRGKEGTAAALATLSEVHDRSGSSP